MSKPTPRRNARHQQKRGQKRQQRWPDQALKDPRQPPPAPKPKPVSREELIGRIAVQTDKYKRRLPLVAKAAHADFDELLRVPPEVTCRKGCSACCRQHVVVSLAEASNLVQAYPDLIAAARPVLERQAKIVPTFHTAEADAIAQNWWKSGETCAFLQNDECSIYAHRPFVCRKYFVLSDPALCASEVATDVVVALPNGANELMAQMWAHEQRATNQVILGSLPKLLLQVTDALSQLEALRIQHLETGAST